MVRVDGKSLLMRTPAPRTEKSSRGNTLSATLGRQGSGLPLGQPARAWRGLCGSQASACFNTGRFHPRSWTGKGKKQDHQLP